MLSPLKFRHRIGLLVLLAALALLTVTAVTLVLGRRSEQQLTGIETRYVPLIEVDRDLKTLFAAIPRALEDAATAGEITGIHAADGLADDFVRRLALGQRPIVDNGGDPHALTVEFRQYFSIAREVSLSLVNGTSAAHLTTNIDAMRDAQRQFSSHLDIATSPDRRRLAAAFATAHKSQEASLQADIIVAISALALMMLISWRLIRRTVNSLHAVSLGVARLAEGEFGYEIVVPSGDEIGDLAREANRTAVRLREYRTQDEREAWIKTGLAELADHIAGELDPITLGRNAMTYLASYVAADAAVVYASNIHGEFRMLASLGVADVASVASTFQLGDVGLGEVVRSDEIRVVSDPLIVRLLGRAKKVSEAIVPLTHEGRTMGVLELAFSQPPDDRSLEFLARVRAMVGIAFRVAESRQRVDRLLVETQRQANAAENANKELEAFSYSVSHDLRAPLRGIDGFSQALLEDFADNLPPKAQEYLQRIRAAAQRMAELIDDLLRLSRVTRADFRRERIDLSQLAGEVVGELRRANPERDVKVVLQDNVTAWGDSRLMKITLENLIGNSWKFTSKVAAPVIEFGVENVDDAPAYFVRDNGAGFDMKYSQRLFSAFQRLHTDKEFPGTGIGLATVHRIVSRHGGRIWVDAEVGKGATFHFTLPENLEGAATL